MQLLSSLSRSGRLLVVIGLLLGLCGCRSGAVSSDGLGETCRVGWVSPPPPAEATPGPWGSVVNGLRCRIRALAYCPQLQWYRYWLDVENTTDSSITLNLLPPGVGDPPVEVQCETGIRLRRLRPIEFLSAGGTIETCQVTIRPHATVIVSSAEKLDDDMDMREGTYIVVVDLNALSYRPGHFSGLLRSGEYAWTSANTVEFP